MKKNDKKTHILGIEPLHMHCDCWICLGVDFMKEEKKKPLPRQPNESHEEFLERARDEFYRQGIRDSKPSVRKGHVWWD